MRDTAGKLHSLQTITPNGDKMFMSGGRVKGCYYSIGKPDGVLIVCEGYQQEKEARHHDAIVNQTIGEGLQAYKLEKLSRYETHLDRKFERTLAMLIKLKDLRSSRTA